MADGISFREFGRRVGVSGEAVSKAVKTGRIPAGAVGEIVLNSGKTRPCIIDEELAKRSWSINTDVTHQRDQSVQRRNGLAAAARRQGRPVVDEPVTSSGPAIPAGGRGGDGPSINDSKKVEAAYKARLAKLEWEERSGKLVNAEQIRVAIAQQVIEARNRVLGVGRAARNRIPHLTIDEVEIIEELCAKAVQEVSLGSD